MKLLSTNPLAKTGAIIAFAMAGLLSVGAAHAVGTASDTSITNISLLSYSVGGTPQNQICSSLAGNSTSTGTTTATIAANCTGGGAGAGTYTTFKVDNKVNFQVTTIDTAFVSVVPGQTTGVFGAASSATATQVARFLVSNTGNSTQDFALTAGFSETGTLTVGTFAPTSVADTFNPSACTVRVESGPSLNAVYDAADTATFIDALAADTTKTVYVICAIPLAQVNSDIAVVSLIAEARVSGTVADGALGAVLDATVANTQTGVEIVFADTAGTDTGDVARDGKHSSRSALRVTTASLTVTKAITTVCDPLNGPTAPKNIPGAFVRYTITVANGGSTAATLTTISDTLAVTNVNFDNNFITGATAAACAAGTASINPALNGFRVVLGTTSAAAGAPVLTARTGYPKTFTSASDADGIEFATPVITATFSNVLDTTGGALAGELRAGETVSVSFQVEIK